MIAKLIIPVIDTENLTFETNVKLTADEYREMVYDNFLRTDASINNYMVNGRKTYYRNGYAVDNPEYASLDIKYNTIECEAMFLDVKKSDITDDMLCAVADNGKMNLLLVNINPNDVDPDAESEIRFWLDDSQRILDDNDIDDVSKIKFLPKRNFEIKTDRQTYVIEGCKMVENRSDDKFPYYFAIIIEKTHYKQ